MGTIKVLLTRFSGSSRSSFEYESYKYEDIQSNWIIHQGYLQYLYSTRILNDSLFKTYRVVLARIPIENMDNIIGLYLYIDDKKPLSYFIPIDEKTKINDRCNRHIRPDPKCFLFELYFNDKDKTEIFGAKDNAERQIWVDKLKSSFTKPKPSPISESDYLQPIPIVKPTRNFTPEPNDRNLNSSDENYSQAEPIDYSQSGSNNNSQIFVWNNIFYSNEKDDYRNILAKIGERGAFLIRPQSKKSSSNDHDYTLCVYHESNNVRCLPIYNLPTRRNEYSLAGRDSKSFVDMQQLCEHYTTNPLPTSINNFYLKKPYKYY